MAEGDETFLRRKTDLCWRNGEGKEENERRTAEDSTVEKQTNKQEYGK